MDGGARAGLSTPVFLANDHEHGLPCPPGGPCPVGTFVNW